MLSSPFSPLAQEPCHPWQIHLSILEAALKLNLTHALQGAGGARSGGGLEVELDARSAGGGLEVELDARSSES